MVMLPQGSEGDIALRKVPYFGRDVKRVSWLSVVIKDPMSLIIE